MAKKKVVKKKGRIEIKLTRPNPQLSREIAQAFLDAGYTIRVNRKTKTAYLRPRKGLTGAQLLRNLNRVRRKLGYQNTGKLTK